MRTIQKTISLEDVTSRIPSVIPAFKDDKLYYFDETSLSNRDYKFTSNYGMIPVTLSFESFPSTSYTLSCGVDSVKISFERLSSWYYFFNEYYQLLKNCGHCNMTYSSATDYYYHESQGRYSDQMIYGNDEETYIELDKKFESIGGNDFYNWICENVIPTYYISDSYRDYWNCDRLYYPDVIKWIAWFKERENYEGDADFSPSTDEDIEHWDCSETSNYCECEEYFKRGGQRELENMQNWYHGIQGKINDLNSDVKSNLVCMTPEFNLSIQLTNSLDNIGQYSSLSPEYELGVDYRTVKTEKTTRGTIIHYESGNTHGGTVADVSGKTMILKNSTSEKVYEGSKFNETYQEREYDKDAWDDYTKHYIENNNEEFVHNDYNFYCIDDEGNMYTGMNFYDVKEKLLHAKKFIVNHTDAVVANGEVCPIIRTEYGIYEAEKNSYLNGKTCLVYREKGTATPYTSVNGKQVYATFSAETTPFYYFSFLKDENSNIKKFGRKQDPSKLGEFVTYNGVVYSVNESGVTNDTSIIYPRISGYTYDENGEIEYIGWFKYNYDLDNLGYEELEDFAVLDEYFNVITNKSASYDENNDEFICFISLFEELSNKMYGVNYITGRTISKLSDLKSDKNLVDDVGNKLNGWYMPSINSMVSKPTAYSELELLYQVGEGYNIKPFKHTELNPTLDIDKNYFVGDVIMSMNFYYKDSNGNVIGEKVAASDDVTALQAIRHARNSLSGYSEEIIDFNVIYCDIIYNVGTTLELLKENLVPGRDFYRYFYTVASQKDRIRLTRGIQYSETVKFVRTESEYCLKMKPKNTLPMDEMTTSGQNHSYIVYTYELEQDLGKVVNDDGTMYEVPIADFWTEINLVDSDSKIDYEGSDMENRIQVAPVYKKEYLLGIASKENIDSNIYIERGINAAFEKHLKLQEINSMEGLLNYGNGFFKIINN